MVSITDIKYLYYLIIKLKIYIYIYKLVENVFEYNMVLVKGKLEWLILSSLVE
jgi:hypothetical protein